MEHPTPRECEAGNCGDMVFSATGWKEYTAEEIMAMMRECNRKLQEKSDAPLIISTTEPAAYIVTDNRGKRYLVFAGSTEYDNAAMFNYEIKPLYE